MQANTTVGFPISRWLSPGAKLNQSMIVKPCVELRLRRRRDHKRVTQVKKRRVNPVRRYASGIGPKKPKREGQCRLPARRSENYGHLNHVSVGVKRSINPNLGIWGVFSASNGASCGVSSPMGSIGSIRPIRGAGQAYGRFHVKTSLPMHPIHTVYPIFSNAKPPYRRKSHRISA